VSTRDDIVAYLERQFPGYDHWYTHADRIWRLIEANEPRPCEACDGTGCMACKLGRDHYDIGADACTACNGTGETK